MKLSSVFIGLTTAANAAVLHKRQVFSTSTYDDISISGGVAGNAAQEALKKLGGLPSDLSTVTEEDLDFLDNVNSICNDAETEAFNVAIDAASGEEADALQVRKLVKL